MELTVYNCNTNLNLHHNLSQTNITPDLVSLIFNSPTAQSAPNLVKSNMIIIVIQHVGHGLSVVLYQEEKTIFSPYLILGKTSESEVHSP